MSYQFKSFYSQRGLVDLEQKINAYFMENRNHYLMEAKLDVDFARGEPCVSVLTKYLEDPQDRDFDTVFKFFIERSNLSILDTRLSDLQKSDPNFVLVEYDHKMSISTGTGTPVTIVMLHGYVQGVSNSKESLPKAEMQEANASTEPETNEIDHRQPIIFKENNQLVQMIQDGQAKI